MRVGSSKPLQIHVDSDTGPTLLRCGTLTQRLHAIDAMSMSTTNHNVNNCRLLALNSLDVQVLATKRTEVWVSSQCPAVNASNCTACCLANDYSSAALDKLYK